MARTIELHLGESLTLFDGTIVCAVRERETDIPGLPTPRELVRAVKARGMTQQQIATQIGISQSTLSKIEAGRREDVRYSNYRALLGLLRSLPEA